MKEAFLEQIQDIFFNENHFIKTNGNPKNWVTIKRKITTDEIADHFSNKYYVGFIKKTTTNILCFDIDVHKEKDKETLQSRFNKIITDFGKPHLISTTPSAGGLHLYYLPTPAPEKIRFARAAATVFRQAAGRAPRGDVFRCA